MNKPNLHWSFRHSYRHLLAEASAGQRNRLQRHQLLE